jgi:hypothetical protein
MLLALRSLFERTSAVVGVAQAPAVVAAALSERFVASAAIAQAAAAVSATLREDFVLSAVAIAQAPATVAGAVLERFIANVAVAQAAAAVSGTMVERFVLASLGPVQAPAVIAATLNAAVGNPTLSIAVAQQAASVAAVLGGGTVLIFDSGSGGAGAYQPARIVRPKKAPAPVTVAATIVQRPAVLALQLATNDDLIVLGLDDDALLDLAA